MSTQFCKDEPMGAIAEDANEDKMSYSMPNQVLKIAPTSDNYKDVDDMYRPSSFDRYHSADEESDDLDSSNGEAI